MKIHDCNHANHHHLWHLKKVEQNYTDESLEEVQRKLAKAYIYKLGVLPGKKFLSKSSGYLFPFLSADGS